MLKNKLRKNNRDFPGKVDEVHPQVFSSNLIHYEYARYTYQIEEILMLYLIRHCVAILTSTLMQ